MKILKIISAIIILFLFSPRCFSQNVRFSFLLDPNINWLSQNDNKTSSDGSVLGINVRINTDFFFSERYAFSTGMVFQTAGGKLQYPEEIILRTIDERILIPPGNTVKYNLRYLGIPVGLKFKTIEIGYMTYWLNLGVSPLARIGSTGTDSGLLEKESMNKEIKLFNIDYFLKGGVEYSLGGETAIIGGLGFNSGIFDVTKRSSDKVYTRSVSLEIGILF